MQPAAASVKTSAVDRRRPLVVVVMLPSPPLQALGHGHASIAVEYGLIRQYPGDTVIVPPSQLSVLSGHGVQVPAGHHGRRGREGGGSVRGQVHAILIECKRTFRGILEGI